MARRNGSAGDGVNPYIALADVAINLALILVFFVAATNALGRAGWEQVRYREAQDAFRQQMNKSLCSVVLPQEHKGKNDPPGVQRWVYPNRALFKPGSSELLPEGRQSLIAFALVLRENGGMWRRIRIEGHTRPPQQGTPDDWELSSSRAATVARVLHARGHIPSYYLAVAGRAGQNPVDKSVPEDPSNERVEILIEYAHRLTAEVRGGMR